jgi:hypothetical protein
MQQNGCPPRRKVAFFRVQLHFSAETEMNPRRPNCSALSWMRAQKLRASTTDAT